LINVNLHKDIIATCNEIAKTTEIVAITLYGSRASGYAREDSDYDILLILKEYPEGVQYNYITHDQLQLAILIVDQHILELDVTQGTLGDFVSGRFLTPLIPLFNPDYIHKIEVETKKRFAQEDLEDLVIEYGDLSRVLFIHPEYLVLARMEKRARAYPPLRYSYINMLHTDRRRENMQIILTGFFKALQDLQASSIIKFDGDHILLTHGFVDKILSYKLRNRVVNFVNLSKNTFQSYLTHGRAGKVSLEIVAKELSSKLKREFQIAFNKQEIEDPKNYLFLKTETGISNLNKQDAIIKTLKRLKGNHAFEVQPLAGALNEVHLVTVKGEKLVVKKFTDWFTFKWFILNAAVYGTKIFSLSGKTRLSNEYVTNQLLFENKIPTPEIISISLEERLLVLKFIEGKLASEIVTEAFNAETLTFEDQSNVFEIGQLVAKIHKLNITLGDCKPENFVIRDDGRLFVLDLEQSERFGDKKWDIAEFLYFSGHFGTTLTGGFQQFVREFIRGYSAEGDQQILIDAAGFHYTRIFLAWTPLPILRGISKMLQNP
jgi:tRNA A-37 threonylcarbamoyl transferase component Bud32/predicted nucleotidyltransferase